MIIISRQGNKSNFFIGIFIAFFVYFFDIFTKNLTFAYLDKNNLQSVEITPFFSLVKVWNNGVSFGLFHNFKYAYILFPIIVGIVILFLILWLYKNQDLYSTFSLGFIIGGACGNMIDRIKNKAVADFLDFYIYNYHWPAFNLADSFIFIGVFMILLQDLFFKKI